MTARQELRLRLRGRPVVAQVDDEGIAFHLKGKQDKFRISWQRAASAAFGCQVFTDREIEIHEANKAARS